jgi:hypothetical protein
MTEAGAEATQLPNKRINLTRPSAEISFKGTARRLCARRWAYGAGRDLR